jgi:hypothetical protein
MIFHLPLRQTEGFLQSLAHMLEVELPSGVILSWGTGNLGSAPSHATKPLPPYSSLRLVIGSRRVARYAGR